MTDRETNQQYAAQRILEIDTQNKDNLLKIKAVLNKIFGKDHNQIVKDVYSNYTDTRMRFITNFNNHLLYYYGIIIHTPEVEISDGRRTHKIRDIYVRVRFNSQLRLSESIHGMRSTFTADEWTASYTHSHLRNQCLSFSPFCTGIGPINQVTALLARNFDIVNFEMLCYHIKQFLKWESIEGTPYHHIASIGTSGEMPFMSMGDHPLVFDAVYKTAIEKFDIEDLQRILRFKIKRKMIDVDYDDRFEVALGKLIQDNYTGNRVLRNLNIGQYLVYKKADGSYTNISSSPVNIGERKLMDFKGRPVMLQILNHRDPDGNNDKYAHPELTKYVCNKLAKQLSKAAVTTQGNPGRRSVNHNRQAAEPDPVAV